MLQEMLQKVRSYVRSFYKQIILLILAHCLLFTAIGMITTSKPSSRLASSIFSSWTSNFDQSIFLTLFTFENRSFDLVMQPNKDEAKLTEVAFEVMTSVKMNDLKSLLGYEIPGFSTYEHKVVVAGEGMSDINLLSHESGPPLEDILQERKAIDEEKEDAPPTKDTPQTDNPVVFLYNSHNRESFLPHLPDETNADHAHHEEVNITKVSDRFSEALEANGIGSTVDDTDVMNILRENDWPYHKSYLASRPIVEEALANNEDLQYAFDIHRDSLPREETVATFEEEEYATVLFIIGAENKNYEKNLEIATSMHYKLEEEYPGVSKGIITKEGPNSNGVYNQDLLDNSVLMEIGGYENTLEEMYRTTDVIASVFSDLYWDAEEVNQ